MTRMMLERMGYTVLTASTPNEAISIMEVSDINAIHLLMTDVVMPEMNGRDLSKKLLSMYPGLKCLFMSGYTATLLPIMVFWIQRAVYKQAIFDARVGS